MTFESDIQKEIYMKRNRYTLATGDCPKFLSISHRSHERLARSVVPMLRVPMTGFLDEFMGLEILLVSNKGDEYIEVMK